MRVTSIVLAGSLWTAALAASSSAQPILNRVEQLLRSQLGTAQNPAAPADASEPGYLGVVADDAADGGRGVRIVSVTVGSPAAQAGLQSGDLITTIDDVQIRTMDDMARALGGKPVGTKLAIAVNRVGVERRQDVTLGRRPASRVVGQPAEILPVPGAPAVPAATPPGPRLGIRTLPVTEEVARSNNLPDTRGATVISVAVGSPAEQAGIPLGAVITAVDNQPVDTPQALAAAIRQAGPEVELSYVDRGQQLRKRVAFAPAAVAGENPKLELRGRPVDSPTKPQPSEGPTPAAPAQDASPVAALEARVRELEARIEKLEAALAGKASEGK